MTGSPVYENWHAHRVGQQSDVIFEFPLYSDSDGIPEIRNELGPYHVLQSRREVPILHDCPSLILRVVRHTWARHEQTGEQIPDEFASLLSLLSGTRLATGSNYTRRFGFDDDPLGQPIFSHEILVVPRLTIWSSNLPRVTERRGIDLPLLRRFPDLSPSQSLVVAKAARLYRIALWYSDSQPEFSWLMFVSAVETAAAFWQQGRLSPEEQLAELRPNLLELLMAAGGEQLLQSVAKELANYMGATRKFLMFISTFSGEVLTPDTSSDRMQKALKDVYSARSKALHSGVAIPDRMPIALPEFEAIARSALLAWWRSLLAVGATPAQSGGAGDAP